MSSKSIFNELHFNDRRSISRNAGDLNIYVHEEINFFIIEKIYYRRFNQHKNWGIMINLNIYCNYNSVIYIQYYMHITMYNIINIYLYTVIYFHIEKPEWNSIHRLKIIGHTLWAITELLVEWWGVLNGLQDQVITKLKSLLRHCSCWVVTTIRFWIYDKYIYI